MVLSWASRLSQTQDQEESRASRDEFDAGEWDVCASVILIKEGQNYVRPFTKCLEKHSSSSSCC